MKCLDDPSIKGPVEWGECWIGESSLIYQSQNSRNGKIITDEKFIQTKIITDKVFTNKVFNLSRNLTRSLELKVVWLYG